MSYKEIEGYDVEGRIANGEKVMMLDRESRSVVVANDQTAEYVISAIRTSRYGCVNADRFVFWIEEPKEEPEEEQEAENESV